MEQGDHIVATMNGEADNVDEDERRIVDIIMTLLHNKSEDRKQPLIDELQHRPNEMRHQ